MCLLNNIKLLDFFKKLVCMVKAYKILGDTHPLFGLKKITFINARNLPVKFLIFVVLNAWKCLCWTTIYISNKNSIIIVTRYGKQIWIIAITNKTYLLIAFQKFSQTFKSYKVLLKIKSDRTTVNRWYTVHRFPVCKTQISTVWSN